jgi:cytochrome c oxidase cbb3-type subunit I
MAQAVAPLKGMAFGEEGSALAFTALAHLSIIIAAKAYTPEYAFHAYPFATASVAAVFAIVNRYYERPVQLRYSRRFPAKQRTSGAFAAGAFS